MSSLPGSTMVKIINNTTGSVSIVSTIATLSWAAPASTSAVSMNVRTISLEKLQELFSEPGVRTLFTRNSLLVRESNVREELGLDPLDEYDLDGPSIVNLLESKDLAKLKEVLEYCSDTVLSMIVDIAKNLNISDLLTLTLIKEFSGIDLYEFMKDEAETKKENNTTEVPGRAKRVTK